ncbi:TetR family transcriptional regulator [Spirillospora sp. NBC_01491]|uniref:TetR family transcriptional regulator n=1 Tax=Spirillospora sp. NBC_01491 TaxID=2976007 RepID=UPI002E36C6DB|nr:TetR family transcriptional regulator [Spirillospora sp. NBC_01491]
MTATAPETRPADPGTPPQGRRERKKQRTREALVDAAFTLFAEKGFDATTVEEITDAVDVSSRTFFRYFASKEDVALTFQEEQARALLQLLAARPDDEPIMTALRQTMVQIARACENGELGFDTGRFECMLSLTADSSTLMAGSLEHSRQKLLDLTRTIALRIGADPDTDLRPHVIASTVMGAFHVAAGALRMGMRGYSSLSEALDEAFGVLEAGVNFPAMPEEHARTAPDGPPHHSGAADAS